MLPNDQALIDEILREKKKNNTLILAHTYQPPEVLAVADLTGDSFALAKLPKASSSQGAFVRGSLHGGNLEDSVSGKGGRSLPS